MASLLLILGAVNAWQSIVEAKRLLDQTFPIPRAHFGDLVDTIIHRDPLRTLTHLARTYGDRAQIQLGRQNAYLLNNADDIREVLVERSQQFGNVRPQGAHPLRRLFGDGLLTSEGEFHKRQHLLPAFHRQRIAAYTAVMGDYAQRTRDRWREGADVDMAGEMQRLTLAIVGKTLFDADVDGDAVLVPLIRLLSLPANHRLFRRRAQLAALIGRIIQERRQSATDHGDLLSMLLLAQENDTGMSDTQVRDEAITLLLAGHETMTNALTWTWYLLSQHPDVEARLHVELDTVLDGRVPTFDILPQLRYTEMVLRESMRLYPPVWMIGRRALDAVELRGLALPANTIVIMSQYVVHHSPQYYPDPERFDPERWTPEARAARPMCAYFPFGDGPRRCIGESFAWTEGIVLLATLAQSWQARLVPGHPVKMLPRATLRPKYGLRMTVRRRVPG